MAKISREYHCRCCHRVKTADQLINASGTCVDCYGHCTLADKGRCDVVKTSIHTEVKSLSKGFPIVDGVPDIDSNWLTFEGE